MRGVVLVAIDIPAETILLSVDLRLLFIGEIAAVGLPIGADLLVEPRFLVLQVAGLPGSQRATFHTLRDAILLVLLAVVNPVIGAGDASGTEQQSRGSYGQEKLFHLHSPHSCKRGFRTKVNRCWR